MRSYYYYNYTQNVFHLLMLSHYYYLELVLSLLALVFVHFHYMSLPIHSLLSHYSNCIDLSSMLPSYLLLFHHSIDNLMHHLILILHYMFMHLLHLLYCLMLLYLYVLVPIFHVIDSVYYMSLLLDYLVLLYLLFLS
jgi:hypothetical protein